MHLRAAPTSVGNEMQQMKAQAEEKINLEKSMMSWVEYSSLSFLAASINSLDNVPETALSY